MFPNCHEFLPNVFVGCDFRNHLNSQVMTLLLPSSNDSLCSFKPRILRRIRAGNCHSSPLSSPSLEAKPDQTFGRPCLRFEAHGFAFLLGFFRSAHLSGFSGDFVLKFNLHPAKNVSQSSPVFFFSNFQSLDISPRAPFPHPLLPPRQLSLSNRTLGRWRWWARIFVGDAARRRRHLPLCATRPQKFDRSGWNWQLVTDPSLSGKCQLLRTKGTGLESALFKCIRRGRILWQVSMISQRRHSRGSV